MLVLYMLLKLPFLVHIHAESNFCQSARGVLIFRMVSIHLMINETRPIEMFRGTLGE